MAELVTNRTYKDVERAAYLMRKAKDGKLTASNRQEYMAGLRGCYNMAFDWNRVEIEVARLATKLGLSLQTKTNWTYSDIATKTEIERYLGNISALCAAVVMPADAPKIPTIDDWIDYRVANNIEKLLLIVDASEKDSRGVIQIEDRLIIRHGVTVTQISDKLKIE